MHLLLLMVIGPLAVTLTIALLYFGPQLARQRREREVGASESTELETTGS